MKYFLLLLFFFAVLDGLAAVAVWWAVLSVSRGEYLTAVVVLAYAISAIAVTASLSLTIAGRVVPRAVVDGDGTTIRPDRWVDGLHKAAAVFGFVAVAVFAIFHPLGRIDIPLPPGNHQYIVITATVAALAGIPNLWRMFQRGGVSFQKLSPTSFELGQGLSSVHGEWDDVVAITDRRPGREPPFRVTLFVKFSGGRIRTQAIDAYTPQGEAIRRLVRYYWLNPDGRSELADGRAVERLTHLLAA